MNFDIFFPENFMKAYLKRFSKKNYPAAFSEYKEAIQPFCQELASCEDFDAQAAALVEKLNGSVSGFGKSRQISDRQFFLALFGSPALIATGDENCKAFAEALQKVWAASHSDQQYGITTYEEIAGGFSGGIVSTFFMRDKK